MTKRHILTGPEGRRIEWTVSGPEAGVPLVFHQGTPLGARPFRLWIDAAARRGLRLVTLARPGYGASDRLRGRSAADVAGDTAMVLDELGASDAYVIGWSGGASSAIACGALLGARVRGVASLAGYAPADAEGLDWEAGLADDDLQDIQAMRRGESVLRARFEARRPAMLEPDPAGLYERLKSTLPEADRTVVTGDFAFDAASAVAEALVPGVDGWIDDQFSVCAPWGVDLDALSGTSIALWHGDADLMVPFAHGAWLAERIPNARAHLKRGEGHMSIGVGYADAILEDLIAHAR